MTSPVLYTTEIRHGRTERVRHAFTYRHIMWLVDLDDLPVPPRPLRLLLGFDARDHVGASHRAIRTNVDRYLEDEGVDLHGGRVLMLANPRTFGYAFNPLSVFWCYEPSGALACIIAEVQNTHGERHCYLVRPDADGRAEVDKQFYVSPFFAVDGSYDLAFTEPGPDLRVSITLRRGPAREPVFTATLTAVDARPVTSPVRAALRHPFPSWRVTTLIRVQGIRLWLRRLPVVRWTPHPSEPTPSPAPEGTR